MAPPGTASHHWSGRVWVPALAGLIVLGLLFGLFLFRDQPAERATADERPTLIRAAEALEAREPAPLRIPRPDEWLFVRTARVWNEGRDVDLDQWTRADHKRRADPSGGGGVETFALDGSELNDIAGVFPDLVETYRFYRDLPADPEAVRRTLYDLVAEHELSGLQLHCRESGACSVAEGAKWDRDSAVFFLVNRLLASTSPPPGVAAKLYRALAGVPGVSDAGTVTDTTGTKALAVRWHPPVSERPEVELPETPHILLDPETFQYRGDYFIYPGTEPGGPLDDGVTWSYLILAAGFVDEAGEFPPLSDRPEAPAVLHKAADRLADGSTGMPEQPRADQWRYLKVARQEFGDRENDREQWLRADFTRRAESVNGGPIHSIDAGAPEGIETAVFTDLADINAFYHALPDDPEAVLDTIYAKVGDDRQAVDLTFACRSPKVCARIRTEPWSRDGAAYALIRRLLYVSAPPPQVQATLFRALAAIPGVDAGGTSKDLTGTKVITIEWTPPVSVRRGLDLSHRVQILIDPDTYRYRGYRELERDPVLGDRPVESHVVLAAGIVDDAGDRP